MQRALIAERGRRKRKVKAETRAKAKFDQQIVAIARTEGVAAIHSDHEDLGRYAARFAIGCVGVADLTLSPKTRQGELILEPPEPDTAEPDELG